MNPATSCAGFDALRITFDASNIWLNVANLPGVQGQVISMDIAADAAAVPEPSTLLLPVLVCWPVVAACGPVASSPNQSRSARAQQPPNDAGPFTSHAAVG